KLAFGSMRTVATSLCGSSGRKPNVPAGHRVSADSYPERPRPRPGRQPGRRLARHLGLPAGRKGGLFRGGWGGNEGMRAVVSEAAQGGEGIVEQFTCEQCGQSFPANRMKELFVWHGRTRER